MKNIWTYDLEIVKNKTVVIFGFGQESRDFAVRLANQNIYFHYFFCNEAAEEEINVTYLNKSFICLKELLSKAEKESVAIVAPYVLLAEAGAFLRQFNLEHLLVEVELLSEELREKEVFIYGTAMNAEWQYQKYCNLLKIVGFCDSNEAKWGDEYCGLEIIPPQKIKDWKNVAVVIASNSWREIEQFLIKNHYAEAIYVDWHWLVAKRNIFLTEVNNLVYYFSRDYFVSFLKDLHTNRLYLHGDESVKNAFIEKMKLFDVESEALIEVGEWHKEQAGENEIHILVDKISENELAKYLDMGITEDKLYWLDQYDSARKIDVKFNYPMYIDPILGYVVGNKKEKQKAGNVRYSFPLQGSKKRPLKIYTLGNSTTAAGWMRQQTWSYYLGEYLHRQGTPCEIICGGASAYHAEQELLKLIRDVVPLKPDVVISFSGVTNLEFLMVKETPFIHPEQKTVFDYISTRCLFQNVELPGFCNLQKEIYYGEAQQEEFDVYEFWFNSQVMMNAICESQGMKFYGFQQPNLYSLKGTTNLDRLAAFGILKNTKGKIVFCNEKVREWIKAAEHFRNSARKKENYPWFVDLSSIFDEMEDVYIDSVHVYDYANKEIAKHIFNKIKEDRAIYL